MSAGKLVCGSLQLLMAGSCNKSLCACVTTDKPQLDTASVTYQTARHREISNLIFSEKHKISQCMRNSASEVGSFLICRAEKRGEWLTMLKPHGLQSCLTV